MARLGLKSLTATGFLFATAALCSCATQAQETAPPAPTTEGSVPDVTPIVQTKYGPVQGLKDRGINEYLGIPYASAPVGELRFMPPEPPETLDYIYDATQMGPPVMQMYNAAGAKDDDITRQLQTTNANQAEVKLGNEDGLYLNVWTPGADDAKRPVMLWIHGGGFAYGSGSWPVYDGNNLAQKDVVVITVNHRLNAFGYLYLGDKFGEDFAKSGNLGQLDLIAALEWTRDNIAAFGGDPDNVTVMGESGGGFKISNLLATPAADGLIHKAIIQSGGAADAGSKEEAAKLAEFVLEEAGIETVEQLRAIPPKKFMAAASAGQAKARRAGVQAGFSPIVDGVVLPTQPFADGAPEISSDVPVMIGFLKDEMTIFLRNQPWFGTMTEEQLGMFTARDEMMKELVAHFKAERPDDEPTYIYNSAASARFVSDSFVLAQEREAVDAAPTYMYYITFETNTWDGRLRATHTLDIPLMFNNIEESRAMVGTGPGPVVMGEMMSDAWVTFARDGKPSSELLPEWDAYTLDDRGMMVLDVEPEFESDPVKGWREILAKY
ncbi:MAG: carboxylesterase [Ponticaulis sp.]|nr:carboxylesterase [Ponticaulis sp.]